MQGGLGWGWSVSASIPCVRRRRRTRWNMRQTLPRSRSGWGTRTSLRPGFMTGAGSGRRTRRRLGWCIEERPREVEYLIITDGSLPEAEPTTEPRFSTGRRTMPIFSHPSPHRQLSPRRSGALDWQLGSVAAPLCLLRRSLFWSRRTF